MEARVRILEKTSELFSKHGIRRVTMDDIAAQCGISKKTIYQYFKDKDELIDAFAVDRIIDSKTGCERDKRRAKNAIHELFLAMDMVKLMFEALHPSLLYDLEKYYPDTFAKFRKYKEEYLYDVIKQNLEWGIREGLYREDIDIKILTRFRLESMLLPFNLDIFPESRYEFFVIEQELMEHFVYGIATDKGRRLISDYKIERLINKKSNV
jgi:TetR/AcrR family transcriptional regulator, cholesterol catabolism regulator